MAGQAPDALHTCPAKRVNRIGAAGARLGQFVARFLPYGATALLVTGANGRIGRALRSVWADNTVAGLPVLWSARRPGPGVDLAWDIGADKPDLPTGVIVLHLAGRLRGTAAELAENVAVMRGLFGSLKGPLLAMSSAAVYAPGPGELRESDAAVPVNDYGRAKLLAEQMAPVGQVTQLRLANLAGADALLGSCRPGVAVVLDPIAGQSGGPERSYIGPVTLAFVLGRLVARIVAGQGLPPVLNVAQPGSMAMVDLLEARGQPWRFGPARPEATPRVVVSVALLQGLMEVPTATPKGLVDEIDQIAGWVP